MVSSTRHILFLVSSHHTTSGRKSVLTMCWGIRYEPRAVLKLAGGDVYDSRTALISVRTAS